MTETICADEGGTDPFVLPARQHPVNRPDPAMVRILDEQGRLTTHPDFPVDLVDDDLVKALEMMVMTRRFDVEATALQRHGGWVCGRRYWDRRPPRLALGWH